MPNDYTRNAILTDAFREALAQAAAQQFAGRGQATVNATTKGLEGQVAWRVAPWWQLTGIVQRPWGEPMSAALSSTFRW